MKIGYEAPKFSSPSRYAQDQGKPRNNARKLGLHPTQMSKDETIGQHLSGFKTAYHSGQSNGSRFTAMAGQKLSNTVREKDKMNPFALANNQLTDRRGPGNMVIQEPGQIYVRAQQ